MKISTIVAALVGTIVMFGLGFLFFGVLLASYMDANIPKAVKDSGLMRTEPQFICLILFNFVWACCWLLFLLLGRGQGFYQGRKIGRADNVYAGSRGQPAVLRLYESHDNWTMIIIDVLVVTRNGRDHRGRDRLDIRLFNKKTEAAA